jgi:hypothetical protein
VDTALGREHGSARELLLESYWWLVHELSGFVNEPEAVDIVSLLQNQRLHRLAKSYRNRRNDDHFLHHMV